MIYLELIKALDQVKHAMSVLTDTSRYAGCSDKYYRDVVSSNIKALADMGLMDALDRVIAGLSVSSSTVTATEITAAVTHAPDMKPDATTTGEPIHTGRPPKRGNEYFPRKDDL